MSDVSNRLFWYIPCLACSSRRPFFSQRPAQLSTINGEMVHIAVRTSVIYLARRAGSTSRFLFPTSLRKLVRRPIWRSTIAALTFDWLTIFAIEGSVYLFEFERWSKRCVDGCKMSSLIVTPNAVHRSVTRHTTHMALVTGS